MKRKERASSGECESRNRGGKFKEGIAKGCARSRGPPERASRRAEPEVFLLLRLRGKRRKKKRRRRVQEA